MTASAPSDYIIYTVECFQLGNQLLSSVTSADIVDTYNAQALQCRTSLYVFSLYCNIAFHGPIYNTVHYNMVLDITLFNVGP